MKGLKRIGSIVVMLALVFGLAGVAGPVKQAQAATKKYVMIKGEKAKVSVLFIGNLTSAKSSKPSVVSVKKFGGNKLKLTAKKAGKATINVRGKYGYGKYNITVKNRKLKCVYKGAQIGSYSGYAYYEITNKCGDYMSSAVLKYDIVDANLNVLKSGEETVYSLVPNAKMYISVYIGGDLITQGATAIRVKSYALKHDMMLSYKNLSSKVSVSYNPSSGAVSFKNKYSKYVSARADIVFYDAAGKVVDVQTVSSYLSGKGKDTKTATTTKQYSDYKVFKRAYA